VLTAAFYKEKLGKMMDMLKEVTHNYLDYLDSEFISQDKPFNLPKEIGDL